MRSDVHPTWAEAKENLRLAGPIMLAQLGTMSMGLVDTALVGRVGERALASVALGNTLSFAAAMPAIGVLMAIEPVASQALGGGDRVRAHAVLRAGVRLAALLVIPTALLTWASLALMPLLKVDPAIIPGARAYVAARMAWLLPFFLFMAGKTHQQAVMRTRAAVEAVVIANVVHAIAGWFAVFRLGLGGVGAGIATSLSSTVLAVWVLWVRADRTTVRAPREMELAIARKLLHVGLPIGVQLSAEVGIFSLVGLLMGRIGGRAAAAHQIAIGLASLSFMGALGVAQATSVRVGLAVGGQIEGGPRRAGSVGMALGLASMTGWAMAFALAPRLLARVFTDDWAVADAAVVLIRVAAIFQLADGLQVVSAGALRGAGDTRWPLLANIFTHWCIGLPLAWVLAFRFHRGAIGLWYGLTGALTVIAIALALRFFRLTRRAVRPL